MRDLERQRVTEVIECKSAGADLQVRKRCFQGDAMQATAEAFTAVKEGLINDEDLATFHRKGYLISKKLFNDEEIARMRKEHERIWNGERDGDGFASKPEQHGTPKNPLELRKHDSPWWINDYVLHFSANPNIGKIAAALMNT